MPVLYTRNTTHPHPQDHHHPPHAFAHDAADPFHPFHHFASIVHVPAKIFAYSKIIHQFPPDHPPAHELITESPAHHHPAHEDASHPYGVVFITRDGVDKIDSIFPKLNNVLYKVHRVCVALVHHAHTTSAGVRFHPFHPATELPVVAYDTATAIPFPPGLPLAGLATIHAHPVCHHKQGPHVPVANAAHHVHGVIPLAFVALFPLRAILAVPERVSVPRTCIA